MTVLVAPGDRLISADGRPSWLKRGSVPFSMWSGGGHVLLSGEAKTISYDSLFRTQPWVAICVNKLTRQISRLPLKTYRRNSQGEKERVTDHPLVALLRTPSPRRGPVHLKQSITLPALVHGNGVLAKFRAERGGPPTELLPLRWPYLQPYDAEGDPAGYDGDPIAFWESTQAGQSRYFAAEEIVHFGWESPECEVGVSPLQQLGVTIKGEDAAQRYSAASFQNAARPGAAVVLPPDSNPSSAERDVMREEIQQVHGGVDNAFRTAILGGGADIKPFGGSAKEAELIDSRKLNREEVAAVYDLPPPLIGILDKATYSNIETQHGMLYTDVLGPWLVMIEETIAAQLIEPEPAFEGLFCEFDLAEVLKGDKLKEIQALREAIQTGLMTPNEGRQIQNLNRVDNPAADELYMPVNNLAPIGAAPQQMLGSNGQQQTLAAHLVRARDRVLTRAGVDAGDEDLLGQERFERELAEDLGDDALAAQWARIVDEGVREAGPDPDRLKQFFSALGA